MLRLGWAETKIHISRAAGEHALASATRGGSCTHPDQSRGLVPRHKRRAISGVGASSAILLFFIGGGVALHERLVGTSRGYICDCLLICVGVPINFPVKKGLAVHTYTKRQVSRCHFILIVKQPQHLFLFSKWVARRRASRECLPCDTTHSPRSTVVEERERYEGVVSVPLSKGLFYEQMNEVATTTLLQV